MRGALLAGVLASFAAGPLLAAEASKDLPAKQQAEAELLEFLGSLDVEEEEWRKYLEDRPIQAAVGKPVPQQKPPARMPAEKPVEVKKQ